MTETTTQIPEIDVLPEDATVGTANDVPADDVIIYRSNDYDRFDFLVGNRPINEAKVAKINQDINEKQIDILKFAPIIVNNHYQILDGQHRFHVAMQRKVPIYYVKAPDLGIAAVASINSRTQNWKISNYLECYVEQELEAYIELKKFRQKYPRIGWGQSIQLFMDGEIATGGGGLESFKEGTMRDRYKEEAYEFAALITKFEEYHEHNPFSRTFMIAIKKLEKAGMWSVNVMIEKLQASGGMIQITTDIKQQLLDLEQHYNYRNNMRQTIY